MSNEERLRGRGPVKYEALLTGKRREVIVELIRDGRASLTEIAVNAGISRTAVRKHIRLLKDEGVMKVQALLNPDSLGLRLVVVLMEVAGSEAMNDIVNRFRDCPRMVFMAVTEGGYNLMAVMVAENSRVVDCISTVCAIRNAEGIRRSEVMIVSELVRPEYIPIKIAESRDRDVAPCGRYCPECVKSNNRKCLGCPATRYYRGTSL